VTRRGPRELWYDNGQSLWRSHAPDSPSTESAEEEFFRTLEGEAEPVCSVDRLHDNLKHLTTRQRFVIECRYGMRDGNPYTKEEVAEMLGISHQMVSQHEEAAVKTLQNYLLQEGVGQ